MYRFGWEKFSEDLIWRRKPPRLALLKLVENLDATVPQTNFRRLEGERDVLSDSCAAEPEIVAKVTRINLSSAFVSSFSKGIFIAVIRPESHFRAPQIARGVSTDILAAELLIAAKFLLSRHFDPS